jgi:hypothetical protein
VLNPNVKSEAGLPISARVPYIEQQLTFTKWPPKLFPEAGPAEAAVKITAPRTAGQQRKRI